MKEEIQKKRESDPEFREAWDESRKEIVKEKRSPRGMTWDEFERQHFTPEEIAESARRAHKMYNREMRRRRKRRRERKEIDKRLK